MLSTQTFFKKAGQFLWLHAFDSSEGFHQYFFPERALEKRYATTTQAIRLYTPIPDVTDLADQRKCFDLS